MKLWLDALLDIDDQSGCNEKASSIKALDNIQNKNFLGTFIIYCQSKLFTEQTYWSSVAHIKVAVVD